MLTKKEYNRIWGTVKGHAEYLQTLYGDECIKILNDGIKELAEYPSDNINQIIFFSKVLKKIKEETKQLSVNT